MSIKLYVGNVSTSALNAELKELFEKFGKVVECDILKEFAFVHMESDNDAKAAIAGLNDSLWKGARLRVELSTTKTQKGEPARREQYQNNYNMNNNNMFRGGMGHRGGFADRGRGGRGGFINNDRRGFNSERGGRGMTSNGGMRGGGGFRGGRGGFDERGGDARTMSRGGFQERFAPGHRREYANGGGPIRESRFAGRPCPDAGFERGGPPMRDGRGGFGGSVNPMHGGGYMNESHQHSGEFRQQHQQFSGSSEGFMRPPVQNRQPGGMNGFGGADGFQHNAAVNATGPPVPHHHHHHHQHNQYQQQQAGGGGHPGGQR